LIHQLDAAIADHLIKALDSIEVSIDEQLVYLLLALYHFRRSTITLLLWYLFSKSHWLSSIRAFALSAQPHRNAEPVQFIQRFTLQLVLAVLSDGERDP
jgi:hypothetical protein